MKLRHLVLTSVIASLTTLGVEAALSTPEGQKASQALLGSVREQIARLPLGDIAPTPLEIALASDDAAEVDIREIFSAPPAGAGPRPAHGNALPASGKPSGADGNKALTPTLRQAIQDGQSDQDWQFTRNGFSRAGAPAILKAPDAGAITWPLPHAVRDDKTGRVFGLSSNVYARVYRGDPETGEVTRITEMRGPDFSGAIWSPDREQLIITGMASFAGPDPVVVFVDPDSGDAMTLPLQGEKFTGLEEVLARAPGGRPNIAPLAIDGDLLVVAARPDRLAITRDQDTRTAPAWLIDLETREVQALDLPAVKIPR